MPKTPSTPTRVVVAPPVSNTPPSLTAMTAMNPALQAWGRSANT